MSGASNASKGVVYIATGDRYLAEAAESARSVRRVMPLIHITLFTDREVNSELFDSVERIEAPTFSLTDKVRNIGRTPYDYTAFLDCDTYLCADISELFKLLDRFDLLAAHDTERSKEDSAGVPRAFPELNTGFFLFHKARAKQFLIDWSSVHEHCVQINGLGCNDQTTFRSALFDSTLRFYILPPEFHCMLWEAAQVCGEVTLLHGRHFLPLADLSAEVNRSTGPRIFKAGLGCHQINFRSQLIAWAAKVTGKAILKVGRKPLSLFKRPRSGISSA